MLNVITKKVMAFLSLSVFFKLAKRMSIAKTPPVDIKKYCILTLKTTLLSSTYATIIVNMYIKKSKQAKPKPVLKFAIKIALEPIFIELNKTTKGKATNITKLKYAL